MTFIFVFSNEVFEYAKDDLHKKNYDIYLSDRPALMYLHDSLQRQRQHNCR